MILDLGTKYITRCHGLKNSHMEGLEMDYAVGWLPAQLKLSSLNIFKKKKIGNLYHK